MWKRIDLMRHGEPVGGRMYRGCIDDPLTERGWQQMRDAAVGRDDWQVIFHSPLKRCRAFAEELAHERGLPHFEDDRLKEIGFGAWEGKTGDQIREEDPEALYRFYHDPVNHQPDGAERLRAFYLRVGEVWDEIAAMEDYETGLIVAHAGVMRAVITHVLKAPLLSMYRMQIPSAGLVSIVFSDERPPTVLF